MVSAAVRAWLGQKTGLDWVALHHPVGVWALLSATSHPQPLEGWKGLVYSSHPKSSGWMLRPFVIITVTIFSVSISF